MDGKYYPSRRQRETLREIEALLTQSVTDPKDLDVCWESDDSDYDEFGRHIADERAKEVFEPNVFRRVDGFLDVSWQPAAAVD